MAPDIHPRRMWNSRFRSTLDVERPISSDLVPGHSTFIGGTISVSGLRAFCLPEAEECPWDDFSH